MAITNPTEIDNTESSSDSRAISPARIPLDAPFISLTFIDLSLEMNCTRLRLKKFIRAIKIIMMVPLTSKTIDLISPLFSISRDLWLNK
jgi:hypothetical protein